MCSPPLPMNRPSQQTGPWMSPDLPYPLEWSNLRELVEHRRPAGILKRLLQLFGVAPLAIKVSLITDSTRATSPVMLMAPHSQLVSLSSQTFLRHAVVVHLDLRLGSLTLAKPKRSQEISSWSPDRCFGWSHHPCQAGHGSAPPSIACSCASLQSLQFTLEA